MYDISNACGLNAAEIDTVSLEQPVHTLIINPILELKSAAQAAGFKLIIASGYRSFDRQLLIWNSKALGQRVVNNRQGCRMDLSCASDTEKMWAILEWSALPGASRHHFGTDVDIYDSSRLPEGYQLQLTREETEGEGFMAPFHLWLSTYLAAGSSGFFRPYVLDTFGVAPEPWHLSYGPLAIQYQQCLTLAALTDVITQANVLLKTSILANLPEIFERYIQVPEHLYPPLKTF